MSTATATRIHVLLAHGLLDRGMASFVHKAMADAGLEVVAVDHLQSDVEFLTRLRQSVSECSAVVILLTRSTLHSQDVPFEIGMALAWERPVYLLYDGIGVSEIPTFLNEYRIRSLTRLKAVVREIAAYPRPRVVRS